MRSVRQVFRGLMTTAALTMVIQSSASAQTLFYNGDFDGTDAVSSEQNTGVSQSMIYENFTVGAGGWNVGGLFGYYLSDVAFTTAAWEIRSGISEGNGGTLMFGATSAVVRTDTGIDAFNFDLVRAEVTGLSFFLDAGNYWFGLSPIGTGSGRAFLATTTGANGVASQVDNSYFINSSFFGVNYGVNGVGDYTGFSLGIVGPQVVETVPEPATMTLLATGLAGLAASRRRKKAAA